MSLLVVRGRNLNVKQLLLTPTFPQAFVIKSFGAVIDWSPLLATGLGHMLAVGRLTIGRSLNQLHRSSNGDDLQKGDRPLKTSAEHLVTLHNRVWGMRSVVFKLTSLELEIFEWFQLLCGKRPLKLLLCYSKFSFETEDRSSELI
jgi:hypothetical protein